MHRTDNTGAPVGAGEHSWEETGRGVQPCDDAPRAAHERRSIASADLADARGARLASLRVWAVGLAPIAAWLAARDGLVIGELTSWVPFLIHLGLAAAVGLVLREWLLLRWTWHYSLDGGPEAASQLVRAAQPRPSADATLELPAWSGAATPAPCDGPPA